MTRNKNTETTTFTFDQYKIVYRVGEQYQLYATCGARTRTYKQLYAPIISYQKIVQPKWNCLGFEKAQCMNVGITQSRKVWSECEV